MEHGKLELAGFESLLTWVMGGGGKCSWVLGVARGGLT